MQKIIIAVHGGAGTISRTLMSKEKEDTYKAALRSALLAGYQKLEKGSSAIDAVQAAVMNLEDCPLFNAGKGAVFTNDGKHEMDASIMDGKTLKAGAVACVSDVRNPVLLARTIMDKSEHVLLSGQGAHDFAAKNNIPFEDSKYFFDQFRYDQLLESRNSGEVRLDHSDKKFGTVGAVAIDLNGNLAAATSTGGMTNKRYGRIGDTPVIGSGTYANNQTCAISCTGHGEYFLRAVVAYDISCLIEYKGLSLSEACELVVNKKLKEMGGEGGLIAIDKMGNFCLPFNSEGMYRGFMTKNEDLVSIF